MTDRLRERKRLWPASRGVRRHGDHSARALRAGNRHARIDPGRRLSDVAQGRPALYKAPGVTSPAVDALHDYLAHYVGLSSASIHKKYA
jgi:hypothetical protein